MDEPVMRECHLFFASFTQTLSRPVSSICLDLLNKTCAAVYTLCNQSSSSGCYFCLSYNCILARTSRMGQPKFYRTRHALAKSTQMPFKLMPYANIIVLHFTICLFNQI